MTNIYFLLGISISIFAPLWIHMETNQQCKRNLLPNLLNLKKSLICVTFEE